MPNPEGNLELGKNSGTAFYLNAWTKNSKFISRLFELLWPHNTGGQPEAAQDPQRVQHGLVQ